MVGRLPTDEEWNIILDEESKEDQKFVYCMKNTKIYCRPSCSMKKLKREEILIYSSAEVAERDGYKPCKRCKPAGKRISNAEWTNQMNYYMNENYDESITLEHLAIAFHSSPFHLHRVYKKEKGYTPNEFLQRVRIQKAIDFLKETNLSVEEVGQQVGLHNTSYFITLFKKIVGTTPKQYQKHKR